jgi:hypothetical protein
MEGVANERGGHYFTGGQADGETKQKASMLAMKAKLLGEREAGPSKVRMR